MTETRSPCRTALRLALCPRFFTFLYSVPPDDPSSSYPRLRSVVNSTTRIWRPLMGSPRTHRVLPVSRSYHRGLAATPPHFSPQSLSFPRQPTGAGAGRKLSTICHQSCVASFPEVSAFGPRKLARTFRGSSLLTRTSRTSFLETAAIPFPFLGLSSRLTPLPYSEQLPRSVRPVALFGFFKRSFVSYFELVFAQGPERPSLPRSFEFFASPDP